MQRILFIAGIIISLVVLLFGLLFFWKSRPSTSGLATRSVSSWVTTPGHPIDVTLHLAADDLPKCPAKQESIDAVLVIDRSGSMANAIGEAGKAAAAFAKVLGQSQGNRVALIAFNDSPEVIAPLDQSTDQLQASAMNLYADGGTDIASALSMSAHVLEDAATSSSVKAVVLLSDGGSGDVRQALDQAQALKTDGVRLIVIGLRGDDYDPDLLRQLATSSSDLYSVDNLPDLTQLYRNLARSLTNVVATDVEVQQPYPSSHFKLIDANMMPSTVQVNSNMLQWSLSALSANGSELVYRLQPKGIGWHDVAGSLGSTSLVACTGAPMDFKLVTGPKVFISPIPPILWLLLPLLLFLIPVIIMWFKRKSRGPAPSGRRSPKPFQFDFSEKPLPPTSFDDVRPLEFSAHVKPPTRYPEALIIGIGESGEKILSEYRRILTRQNNGEMPDSVRLLSVRANLPGERHHSHPTTEAYTGLGSDEQLILMPDLERVTEKIRKHDRTWEYLDWWAEHTPEDAGRAGARMALFADLMGGTGSSLILNALRNRLNGLRSPLVYVLSSLALPEESGMALDLPHFVKQVTGNAGINTRRVITLFYLQRTGADARQSEDVNLNTYAAVRELQRLLLREPWYYRYNVQTGFTGSTETTPIDACYLLDGVGELIDISQISEKNAFYPAVADILVTLLSSEVTTWHQDYINQLPERARHTESLIGYPTVSSLGCSVVQYPMAELKQISKFHFLMDLLYGGLQGQEALGLVRLDPGQSTEDNVKLDSRTGGASKEEYAIQFLKNGGKPNRHPLMALVAQMINGQTIVASDLAFYQPNSQKIDKAFRFALRDELIVLLNGDRGNAITNRSGKLGAGIAFLEALVDILDRADAMISQRVQSSGELSLALRERILNWKQTSENTLRGLNDWEVLFIGKQDEERPSKHSQRRRRHAVEKKTELIDSIYHRTLAGWRKAQNELQVSATPPSRKLLDWDEESQNLLYQKYLGAELLRRAGSGATLLPLENIMGRIGWNVKAVDYDDIVTVRLVIIPPDILDYDSNDFTYSYGADQKNDIWRELTKLSEYYLPLLDSERFGDHLSSLKLSPLTNELVKGREPLAKYHMERLTELGVEPQRQLALTLTDNEWREQVVSQIKQNLNIADPIIAMASNDPYRCSLVGMADIIPFDGFEAISEAHVDYVSDILVHIFRAEQRATRLEKEWYTRRGIRHYFHPRFVRLLENESMLHSFALAYFYNLLTIKPEGTVQQAILSIPDGESPEDIIVARADKLSLFDVFAQGYHLWLKGAQDDALSSRKWDITRKRIQKVMRMERQNYEDLYTYAEDFSDEIKKRLERDEKDIHEKYRKDRRRPWIRDVDIYLWLIIDAEKRESLDF